ncbi:MAG TPA: patatin-like phospholipase family protein [Acidimicrobiales bacterium]|nr:patatin-like phospholipase family protein [Acidimicrobiales bacterium]
MDSPPSVALALGSGGARGYAHIGVLDALRERGHEVVAVAGSSMGAVVGGAFAAGRLEEYRTWVTGIGQFELLRLFDFALSQPGALRGDKLFAKIHALIGDVRIEDLAIPYTAVAVDLIARREVWFQRGSLEAAMRASGALPSLFPPVETGGRLLIDGGILNPLPLAPTAAAHADLVIAVSLHGDPLVPLDFVDDEEPLVARIRALASRTLDRDLWAIFRPGSRAALEGTAVTVADAAGVGERPPTRLTLGKFDMVNMAIETMQAALVEHKLAGYRPDVLITVPRNACRSLDFHRADELIALGHALAGAALDEHAAGRPPAAGGPPVAD